ncbi:hypothetical protein [Arhodomonas sp. AD133]|uniref:hypothetical protein n=1 Tax=Arhodomonas sp. AD133 TaxID=3415009 RepID=UPI003EBAADC5
MTESNTLKLSKNVAITFTVAFLLGVFGFVLGLALISKYTVIREMQIYEEQLAENLTMFSYCKKEQCGTKIQKMLVRQNDKAIDRVAALQQELDDSSVAQIPFGVPIVAVLSYGSIEVPSSENLRHDYERLGCGLNGVICTQNAPNQP